MNITLMLALYAAVLASLLLIIEIIKIVIWKQKVKLAIVPRLKCTHPVFPNYPQDTVYVGCLVTNKGRKPVNITSHGVYLKNSASGSRYLRIAANLPGYPGALPNEIYKGQNYQLFGDFEELKKQTDNFHNVNFFYVTDATGRVYKKKMDKKLFVQFTE